MDPAAYDLDPSDEYPHEPEAASNYNESMYVNSFDQTLGVGGWFRLGNRVNEGYAEMSACVYLPGGRVAFMFGRPRISTNAEMNAGGMRIDVVRPFEELRVTYDGPLCVLDRPEDMAEPRTAFRENPHVLGQVDLTITGTGPMYGGRPRPAAEHAAEQALQHAAEQALQQSNESSFAKAHYEQHVAGRGTITVGDERFEIDGLGLRDKSWGPRYWQAVDWYRWLPINFGPDLAMVLSVTCVGGTVRSSGVVIDHSDVTTIRDIEMTTTADASTYHRRFEAVARTDNDTWEVAGRVESLIPLRNRRQTPDGEWLHTRITEAMTRYSCRGHEALGMSEYLDQIIDGQPVGPYG